MNSDQRQCVFCVLIALVLSIVISANVSAQKPRFDDPKKTDADFEFQGEYSGKIGDEEYGVQIIAQGKGEFRAVGFPGGLPGDGWNGNEKMEVKAVGKRKDGAVSFVGDEHGNGTIRDGVLKITTPDGDPLGSLKKVVRKSKTLGKMPPKNAVVLFDGSNADQWKNGKMTDDGLLQQGTTSKATFGSHHLHIEFRLPYMPQDRGQGRGNSGIYIQGRYEVQMLDSFGLEGKMNECGGIYSVAGCDINMCYPPLSWQTYDIEYTAAKYKDGVLVANPRITVLHNGVTIHDNVELPGKRKTTAAPLNAGPSKGPVYLQNHGCPVRYRNIWVVEKK